MLRFFCVRGFILVSVLFICATNAFAGNCQCAQSIPVCPSTNHKSLVPGCVEYCGGPDGYDSCCVEYKCVEPT